MVGEAVLVRVVLLHLFPDELVELLFDLGLEKNVNGKN